MTSNEKNELYEEIQAWAENAVLNSPDWSISQLDYSKKSVAVLEALLDELSHQSLSLSEDELQIQVQEYGCYLLMTAKHVSGGTFYWNDEFTQPMLIVGEPGACIALFTWNKVKGRLLGDKKDNIAYFFEEFANNAKHPESGDQVAYM